MIIGVDSGKSNTKWAVKSASGDVQSGQFPTSVRQTTYGDFGTVVMYQNKRYIVGEEFEHVRDLDTNKLNETHLIATLTAVAESMKKLNHQNGEVKISVNMPLNEFLNEDKRNELVTYYRGSYVVEVDKKSYTFNLNPKPYYEGLGIFLRNRHAHDGVRHVCAVDLGSLNTNVITYSEKLKPLAENSFCDKGGTDKLMYRFKNFMMINYDEEINRTFIEKIFTGQASHLVADEVNSEAEKQALDYLFDLKSKMSQHKIIFSRTQFIFGGGGAILLEKHLRDVFGQDIVIDGEHLHANAIGSLELLA